MLSGLVLLAAVFTGTVSGVATAYAQATAAPTAPQRMDIEPAPDRWRLLHHLFDRRAGLGHVGCHPADHHWPADRVGQIGVMAMNGLLFVDANTGMLSRVTIQAADIPASCPIRENRSVIDYGQVRIAGQDYTLPLAASAGVVLPFGVSGMW